MQHHFDAVLPAPFGKVGVRVDGTQVHEIVYLPDSFAEVPPTSALTKRVAEQLDAYYANADTVFDLPLGHKDDAWSRGHFDAITVMMGDGPRPEEIVVVMALTDGGRLLHRIGEGAPR